MYVLFVKCIANLQYTMLSLMFNCQCITVYVYIDF